MGKMVGIIIIDSYARPIYYKNIEGKLVILSDRYVKAQGQNTIVSTKIKRVIGGVGCNFGADDGMIILNMPEPDRIDILNPSALRSDVIGWITEDEYEKLRMLDILGMKTV